MWRLSRAGALVVMRFKPTSTDWFGRAEEERNEVATTSIAENAKRHPGKSSDAADQKNETKRASSPVSRVSSICVITLATRRGRQNFCTFIF